VCLLGGVEQSDDTSKTPWSLLGEALLLLEEEFAPLAAIRRGA
jgi:hypothetical protein